MEQFSRIVRMLNQEWLDKLQTKKVAVFGLGGVGSYVVEALVRNGIGEIVLVDHDIIDITNLNRQLYALHSTVGMNKVDVAKARCLDINPNLKITTYKNFYLPDQGMESIFLDCDFVVDAIDTVKAKIALIENCYERNIKIISSMGTGNKLNPEKFEITDIYKTSVCPLARVMRRELKTRGIKKCTVLYSKETPQKVDGATPGSVSFVPSVAGLMLAGYVIKELVKEDS
ncbi:MAG: tRNA threonylcarbamoyladenosine dehydratase [[Clostridium] spiroforme]|uniref:tRNA threonylcarbamoyladenosine dehydratase n=1 Tax=Thomasclavelia spiroformis TaxID=29348 RepID=A0A943I6T6_9FIRM|nr:tRNA threonylcarbamoyladenosine dehydratase [Thomasclavelia spiroformis]MBS5588639.1 tRNA threonylcarbamoyladenosine dehydratase [Thomasclavelia spiroformis]